MEVYEDMESDAPDAPGAANAPNATTNIEGKENETGVWKEGIRQIAARNRSGIARVLRPAGGSKGRSEARQNAKDRPVSIAALKLIAEQGADEKAQLEQWKKNFVSKITCELAQLQKAHEEVMEAQSREMENQRAFFTVEIEALKEEVRELKKGEEETFLGPKTRGGKLTMLDKSAKTKAVTPAPSQQSPQESPTSIDIPTSPVMRQNEQRSYAAVAASPPSKKTEQPWTQVSYKNRRQPTHQSKLPKAEHQRRRFRSQEALRGTISQKLI